MSEQPDPPHVACPITGTVLVFESVAYTDRGHQSAHHAMIEAALDDMGWVINGDGQWQTYRYSPNSTPTT